MSATDTQRYFDIPAAAKYLEEIGVAGATAYFIRGLISTGELPHLKVGKKFYVSRNAIDAWLNKCERRLRP